MTTKNFRFKSHAFQSQSGRCYYCGLPMWLDHPEHFAIRFGITVPQSKQLQCTAEHLVASQDGGSTSQGNIVAACLFCNKKRHQRKIALNPVKHKELVKKRLSVQRWHPFLSAKLSNEGRKQKRE
ncbi:MAG TPA: HNH endonuclease [Candidatus Nanoperiomorbaceae bacterium]|nr:HNH endonuclease [Candidatus Nanoperiomorbaceae bacterium]